MKQVSAVFWIGMAIAVIFRVAATLGLGAAQINSGLSFLIGIPNALRRRM